MARLTKAHQELQLAREKEKMEALKKKADAQKKRVRYEESWRNELTMDMLKETEFTVGSKESQKLSDIVDLYDFFNPILVYRTEDDEPFKLDYEYFLESKQKFDKVIEKLDKELEEFNDKKKKSDGVTEESKEEIEVLEESQDNETELSAETISKKYLKRNNEIAKYFSRFVPVYNKYTCSCCGRVLPLSHFFVTNRNLYWNKETFEKARESFENGGRSGTLIGCYITEINDDFSGCTFKDSPFLQEDYFENEGNKIEKKPQYAPLDWTKEEAKNQKDVIHLLGYDPFQYEDNDDDKKILYADLISILDEDIQQDYVKLQSALTIVKSFTKVRHLDERMHQMELEDAPLNAQKAIADLKAKELKAISDFSRDSGFSERFKTRQSQGQTSFTGIVKQMNEKQYENELINKYDVQTSSTIQAAADASFKAIFNQLNLSEAEVYKIAAEQLAELRKVKQENEKLKEQLRREKYKVAQAELKEEAREKGLEVYDE